MDSLRICIYRNNLSSERLTFFKLAPISPESSGKILNMIKFVLHGGYTKFRNRDNNEFYKEMTFGLNGKVRVLINCFARDDEQVADRSERHKKRFLLHSINKNLQFDVAVVDKLASQVKWADVMYIDGGDTVQLTKKLSLTSNLEKLFEGKIIGGSSAGVYTLVKYYYGNNSKQLGNGLGILPIKAYCHYEAKDKAIVKKLNSYKENLPLLVLPDYKWVVIHK